MADSRHSRELKPMIPQGVQCYFGEEVSRRRKVEAILAAIMKNWGFQEIILRLTYSQRDRSALFISSCQMAFSTKGCSNRGGMPRTWASIRGESRI